MGVDRREEAADDAAVAFFREVVRITLLVATGCMRARTWEEEVALVIRWWESVAVWGSIGDDEGKGGRWVT